MAEIIEGIIWNNVSRNLNDLTPYEYNPRKISKADLKLLRKNIEDVGYHHRIAVDTDNTIIAGHQRWDVLKQLGFESAEVLVPSQKLTPEQFQQVNITDNVSNGDWVQEMLNDHFNRGDLIEWGMKEEQLLTIQELDPKVGLTDDDSIPEVIEPISKLGDLYELGEHRLLCGDSTNITDVERLMGGDLADMVFTDPPYNVDYEGNTADKLKIQNDAMGDDEFVKFLNDAFTSYFMVMKKTASIYVCHASTKQIIFQQALESAGFSVRNQIVWAKNHFSWGLGRYKYKHEPIFYCHFEGESDAWYGDKTATTLWEVARPAANKVHPTMKPIELIEIALLNSSKQGDLILDLFGGSGSTLVASHKRNRKCYTMELDPIYVDVIVKRWEEYAGLKANLVSQ